MRDYYTSFYNSAAWRKLRAVHVKYHPLCEHCKAKGLTTPTAVVDHIIEILDDYSKRLSPKNLQSLCLACHNKKTAQEHTKRTKDKTSQSTNINELMNNRNK